MENHGVISILPNLFPSTNGLVFSCVMFVKLPHFNQKQTSNATNFVFFAKLICFIANIKRGEVERRMIHSKKYA